MAAALAAADPANAAAYAANAEAFASEMAALAQAIAARLAPLRGRPFIVFHDAYQYFEHAFGLPAAGSVALHDGDAPGTARVAAIRDRVRAEGVVCAFAEPRVRAGAARDGHRGHRRPDRHARRARDRARARGRSLSGAARGLADGLAACLAP